MIVCTGGAMEAVNRIGSALGKKKTAKGTPDTYVSLPNGKYVFVEYTSQERNLPKKLSDNLAKCFDANVRDEGADYSVSKPRP
jgi:hypothetical protein